MKNDNEMNIINTKLDLFLYNSEILKKIHHCSSKKIRAETALSATTCFNLVDCKQSLSFTYSI